MMALYEFHATGIEVFFHEEFELDAAELRNGLALQRRRSARPLMQGMRTGWPPLLAEW